MLRCASSLIRHLLLAVALTATFSCGATPLSWQQLPPPQDPAPSGPPRLRNYKEAYTRALGNCLIGGIDEEQLLRRIGSAHVLYLGDHHDDPGLHRAMLDLLDAVQRSGRKITFGLEAIGPADSENVRAYVAGEIELYELRVRVAERWPGSWLDNPQVDMAFYRALLQRARSWHSEVFALEPVPRLVLTRRDPEIAARIRRAAAARTPGELLVIVVGQAHLLPARVIERVGLPNVALAGRLSVDLDTDLTQRPRPVAEQPYLVSASGVLLVHPEVLGDELRPATADGP